MGQPVTVIEQPSTRPGVVRFETNRVLSGTGHEVFRSIDDAQEPTPSAQIARRLFERGGVEAVHVNANMITVYLADGSPPTGIKEIIEDLYTYYRPGVEVVVPEGASSD